MRPEQTNLLRPSKALLERLLPRRLKQRVLGAWKE